MSIMATTTLTSNSLGWIWISFIGLNLLMLLASVGGFIFGNIKFGEGDVRMWSNGSFVGGWLSSACFVYFLYSFLGVLGGWKGNLNMIYIYFSLTVSSFVLRMINFILFWAHGATLDKWANYVFLVQEVVMISLTILIIIKMKHLINKSQKIIASEESIVIKTSRGASTSRSKESKTTNPFEEA